MNTELEVKEVGSVVASGDQCVIWTFDSEGNTLYWCGKGKVTTELSEAKVYGSFKMASAACDRIKSNSFCVGFLAFEQQSDNGWVIANTATIEGDARSVFWSDDGNITPNKKEAKVYGSRKEAFQAIKQIGSVDGVWYSEFMVWRVLGDWVKAKGLAQVNEAVSCEVELPVTTKMADCLLEIADMPSEAMRGVLVNTAKALRGLEDCQAAKTVDVGQTDVMLIDNGSPENDFEWRYIVAGVGGDGATVYLTNRKKWLFSVCFDDACRLGWSVAKVCQRISKKKGAASCLEVVPVPNDEKLFEQLALSGRPKRREFEGIKGRIYRIVEKLKTDMGWELERNYQGQIEGLLYSLGYSGLQAKYWCENDGVREGVRPRKQLKWKVEELLEQVKRGDNCPEIDSMYKGIIEGVFFALLDTPCEAKVKLCEMVHGGEL